MENVSEEENKKRVEEAIQSTNYIIEESKKREHDLAVTTARNVMEKFQKIELKERCLRVKFLDWLSDKLLDYSKRVHEMSVRIDSPCVIRLPKTKETKESEKIKSIWGNMIITARVEKRK